MIQTQPEPAVLLLKANQPGQGPLQSASKPAMDSPSCCRCQRSTSAGGGRGRWAGRSCRSATAPPQNPAARHSGDGPRRTGPFPGAGGAGHEYRCGKTLRRLAPPGQQDEAVAAGPGQPPAAGGPGRDYVVLRMPPPHPQGRHPKARRQRQQAHAGRGEAEQAVGHRRASYRKACARACSARAGIIRAMAPFQTRLLASSFVTFAGGISALGSHPVGEVVLLVGGACFRADWLPSWRAERYPPDPTACSKCGYSLAGNVSRTCPECGMPTAKPPPRPGSPDDLETGPQVVDK